MNTRSATDSPLRILVTGGAGFIGSNIVDGLIAAGHEVIVVDDLSTGHRANVDPRSPIHIADIRDRSLHTSFSEFRPEVVVHCAAQVDVRKGSADPVHDASINFLGSVNVLQASIENGVRKIVYLSTGGAVYGEPEYLPVDEAHPIRPLCEYGASKHGVEHYLDLYGQTRGLDWTILRLPNVYGPRQDPYGEGGVIAIFAARMLRDAPCTIFGDGGQVRDFLFVQDVVVACCEVVGERGSGMILNLGWGEGTSINSIFKTLARLTGYTKSALHAPAKIGETYRIYLDAARANRELGWRPTISLEDGLKATLDSLAPAVRD